MFETPCRCKQLRMVRDRLAKLLRKERQRNTDLKTEIIKLRRKLHGLQH